jgi:hypothetical protein
VTPLEAAVAMLRDYEDFPRTIDRNDLAERVLSGGVVHQHEREFIADWLKDKKQNHRPRSFKTAVESDAIARAVSFSKATGQRLSQKQIGNAFGVSTSTVRKAVRELSPQRKKNIAAWAVSLATSGVTLESIAELFAGVTKRR